jgi:hypothetical protein
VYSYSIFPPSPEEWQKISATLETVAERGIQSFIVAEGSVDILIDDCSNSIPTMNDTDADVLKLVVANYVC